MWCCVVMRGDTFGSGPKGGSLLLYSFAVCLEKVLLLVDFTQQHICHLSTCF